MKLSISKDITRLRYILRRLFHNDKFDFNREDYLKYTLFHENGLFVKTEAIKRLLREHFYSRSLSGDKTPLLLLDVGCGLCEIDELIQCDFVEIVGIESAIQPLKKATTREQW